MSRGNPCVEYMLDNQLPYISGPQWLGENILRNKHVLSVPAPMVKPQPAACWSKFSMLPVGSWVPDWRSAPGLSDCLRD